MKKQSVGLATKESSTEIQSNSIEAMVCVGTTLSSPVAHL